MMYVNVVIGYAFVAVVLLKIVSTIETFVHSDSRRGVSVMLLLQLRLLLSSNSQV